MDHFAGLDVSVKETSICIVNDTGRIVREVKVASELYPGTSAECPGLDGLGSCRCPGWRGWEWKLGFLLTRFWVGPGAGRGDGSRGGARARQLTFLTFLMSEASRSRVSLASCEICLSVGITGLFSNAVPSPNFTSTDVRKLFCRAIGVSESNNTYEPVTGKPTAQFLMVAPPIFALIGLISTTVTTGTKSLCLPSLWRR